MLGAGNAKSENKYEGRLEELLLVFGWVIAIATVEAMTPNRLRQAGILFVLGMAAYLLPTKGRVKFPLYTVLLCVVAISWALQDNVVALLHRIF